MADAKTRHATAIARFKFVAETEADQRKRELAALRFQSGDHWPEDAKISRAGLPANSANGAPAVPARPMLVMRTIDQPIAIIVNQERQADLGITIIPKDGDAKKETAEVLQGLCRAIEVDSDADSVYSWGFQRQAACGRGYWRVDKALEKGVTNKDQVLRIRRILNGASVYLDPFGEFQDQGGMYSDPAGEYGFITEDIPEAAYKRRFGKSKLVNASDSELLDGLGDSKKYWVIENEAGKTYRIAEYFEAVYGADGERNIVWNMMNGVEFLDGGDSGQEWDGHYIPIVADLGNEYNVGGQRIWEGIVQPVMSPCLMLDVMCSSAVEKIGLSTAAPWIGVAGQFQGYDAWWDQANVRNFSKLEYNAVTAATGGQLLPPPTRNNDNPQIQAYAEMIGLMTNFIRSTTGVPDAALGHVNPNDRSGKAIEELKRASEQGTSNYLDNHARSIRHTGIILLDLIPAIYDRPGRVERILGQDGEPQSVILNQPFTRNADGMPQPQGLMGKMAGAIGMGGQVEKHVLNEGQYSVIVRVGKSKDTLRQETFAGMSALAQAAPDMVPRFADLWVKSMDIPMADEIADRIKPPGVDGPEALPPEAQAQMQQMQAVIQELQQAADDNKTKIMIAQGGDQVKAQIAQQSDQVKLQVAGIQAQSSITVAEIGAAVADMAQQVKTLQAMIGAEHEARMAELDHQREMRKGAHDAGHDVAKAAMEHEHAKELAQISHAQALQSGEVSHQQNLEAGQQPPPLDPNRMVETENGA